MFSFLRQVDSDNHELTASRVALMCNNTLVTIGFVGPLTKPIVGYPFLRLSSASTSPPKDLQFEIGAARLF